MKRDAAQPASAAQDHGQHSDARGYRGRSDGDGPVWGCGSYEALIRLYIGEGLRRDEAKLEEPEVKELGDKLQREGLPEEVILERVAETLQKIA